MIDPNDTTVQDLRRIFESRYLRSERQRDVLFARQLPEVFNVSQIFAFDDLRNAKRSQSLSTLMNAVLESAAFLGIKTLPELLETPYEKLCSAPKMSAVAMAFLLDYTVALGLPMTNAPPIPPSLVRKTASAS